MSFGKYKFSRALCFTTMALIALAMSPTADAQQSAEQTSFSKDVGASERVNFAGKLRMLSQRVVASGCNYAAGIEPEESGADMRAAKLEFNAIVDALENGNSELGIHGSEKRKKTLFRIDKLKDVWAPTLAHLTTINETKEAGESVASLAGLSGPLLDEAKTLVGEISAQYSDPAAMVQASAFQIDIAGRQRMLAQRISKNVCLIVSGFSQDAATAELATTAQMFEVSLYALRGGNTNAGIAPPPNAEVSGGLNVVVKDWEALKPAVESVVAGASLSQSERGNLYNRLNDMTANMNHVVGLYSKASKQISMY